MQIFNKKITHVDFPGGPGFKTELPLQGHRFNSWLGKFTCHVHCGQEEKMLQKKKKKENNICEFSC